MTTGFGAGLGAAPASSATSAPAAGGAAWGRRAAGGGRGRCRNCGAVGVGAGGRRARLNDDRRGAGRRLRRWGGGREPASEELRAEHHPEDERGDTNAPTAATGIGALREEAGAGAGCCRRDAGRAPGSAAPASRPRSRRRGARAMGQGHRRETRRERGAGRRGGLSRARQREAAEAGAGRREAHRAESRRNGRAPPSPGTVSPGNRVTRPASRARRSDGAAPVRPPAPTTASSSLAE